MRKERLRDMMKRFGESAYYSLFHDSTRKHYQTIADNHKKVADYYDAMFNYLYKRLMKEGDKRNVA